MIDNTPIDPTRRDPSYVRSKSDFGLSRVDNFSSSDLNDMILSNTKDKINLDDAYEVMNVSDASFIPILRIIQPGHIRFSLLLYNSQDEKNGYDINISFDCVVSNTNDLKNKSDWKIDYIAKIIGKHNSTIEPYSDFQENTDITWLANSTTGSLTLYIKSNYTLENGTGPNNEIILVQNKINPVHHFYLNIFEYVDGMLETIKDVGQYVSNVTDLIDILTIPCTFSSQNVEDNIGLAVYDKLMILHRNRSGVAEDLNSTNYNFPTINGTPFSGNKDLKADGKDTRNVTVTAYHSGSTKALAGSHDWGVLSDYPVANINLENDTYHPDDLNKFGTSGVGLSKSISFKSAVPSRSTDDVDLMIVNLLSWMNNINGNEEDFIPKKAFVTFLEYLISILKRQSDDSNASVVTTNKYFSWKQSSYKSINVTNTSQQLTIYFNSYSEQITTMVKTGATIKGEKAVSSNVALVGTLPSWVTLKTLNIDSSGYGTLRLEFTENESAEDRNLTVTLKNNDYNQNLSTTITLKGNSEVTSGIFIEGKVYKSTSSSNTFTVSSLQGSKLSGTLDQVFYIYCQPCSINASGNSVKYSATEYSVDDISVVCPSWCTVTGKTISSGTGQMMITVKSTENIYSNKERSGKLTVSFDGNSGTTTLTLKVNNETFYVKSTKKATYQFAALSSAASIITTTVCSNNTALTASDIKVNVSYGTSNKWLNNVTVTKVSGSETDYKVSIDMTKNTTGTVRSCDIILTNSIGLEIKLELPQLSITITYSYAISSSKYSYTIEATAQTLTVDVLSIATANTGSKIGANFYVSDKSSWISVDDENIEVAPTQTTSVKLNLKILSTETERTGHVVLTCTEDHSKSININITLKQQAYEYILTSSVSNIEFSASAGAKDIIITSCKKGATSGTNSPCNFIVSNCPSWISLNVSGTVTMSSNTKTVSLSVNAYANSRAGTIILTCASDKTKTLSIDVSLSGETFTYYISSPNTSYSISSGAQKITPQIISYKIGSVSGIQICEFTATTSKTGWITLDKTINTSQASGKTNDKPYVNYEISIAETSVARSGSIVFTSKGDSTKSVTVNVSLSALDTNFEIKCNTGSDIWLPSSGVSGKTEVSTTVNKISYKNTVTVISGSSSQDYIDPTISFVSGTNFATYEIVKTDKSGEYLVYFKAGSYNTSSKSTRVGIYKISSSAGNGTVTVSLAGDYTYVITSSPSTSTSISASGGLSSLLITSYYTKSGSTTKYAATPTVAYKSGDKYITSSVINGYSDTAFIGTLLVEASKNLDKARSSVLTVSNSGASVDIRVSQGLADTTYYYYITPSKTTYTAKAEGQTSVSIAVTSYYTTDKNPTTNIGNSFYVKCPDWITPKKSTVEITAGTSGNLVFDVAATETGAERTGDIYVYAQNGNESSDYKIIKVTLSAETTTVVISIIENNVEYPSNYTREINQDGGTISVYLSCYKLGTVTGKKTSTTASVTSNNTDWISPKTITKTVLSDTEKLIDIATVSAITSKSAVRNGSITIKSGSTSYTVNIKLYYLEYILAMYKNNNYTSEVNDTELNVLVESKMNKYYYLGEGDITTLIKPTASCRHSWATVSSITPSTSPSGYYKVNIKYGEFTDKSTSRTTTLTVGLGTTAPQLSQTITLNGGTVSNYIYVVDSSTLTETSAIEGITNTAEGNSITKYIKSYKTVESTSTYLKCSVKSITDITTSVESSLIGVTSPWCSANIKNLPSTGGSTLYSLLELGFSVNKSSTVKKARIILELETTGKTYTILVTLEAENISYVIEVDSNIVTVSLNGGDITFGVKSYKLGALSGAKSKCGFVVGTAAAIKGSLGSGTNWINPLTKSTSTSVSSNTLIQCSYTVTSPDVFTKATINVSSCTIDTVRNGIVYVSPYENGKVITSVTPTKVTVKLFFESYIFQWKSNTTDTTINIASGKNDAYKDESTIGIYSYISRKFYTTTDNTTSGVNFKLTGISGTSAMISSPAVNTSYTSSGKGTTCIIPTIGIAANSDSERNATLTFTLNTSNKTITAKFVLEGGTIVYKIVDSENKTSNTKNISNPTESLGYVEYKLVCIASKELGTVISGVTNATFKSTNDSIVKIGTITLKIVAKGIQYTIPYKVYRHTSTNERNIKIQGYINSSEILYTLSIVIPGMKAYIYGMNAYLPGATTPTVQVLADDKLMNFPTLDFNSNASNFICVESFKIGGDENYTLDNPCPIDDIYEPMLSNVSFNTYFKVEREPYSYRSFKTGSGFRYIVTALKLNLTTGNRTNSFDIFSYDEKDESVCSGNLRVNITQRYYNGTLGMYYTSTLATPIAAASTIKIMDGDSLNFTCFLKITSGDGFKSASPEKSWVSFTGSEFFEQKNGYNVYKISLKIDDFQDNYNGAGYRTSKITFTSLCGLTAYFNLRQEAKSSYILELFSGDNYPIISTSANAVSGKGEIISFPVHTYSTIVGETTDLDCTYTLVSGFSSNDLVTISNEAEEEDSRLITISFDKNTTGSTVTKKLKIIQLTESGGLSGKTLTIEFKLAAYAYSIFDRTWNLWNKSVTVILTELLAYRICRGTAMASSKGWDTSATGYYIIVTKTSGTSITSRINTTTKLRTSQPNTGIVVMLWMATSSKPTPTLNDLKNYTSGTNWKTVTESLLLKNGILTSNYNAYFFGGFINNNTSLGIILDSSTLEIYYNNADTSVKKCSCFWATNSNETLLSEGNNNLRFGSLYYQQISLATTSTNSTALDVTYYDSTDGLITATNSGTTTGGTISSSGSLSSGSSLTLS